VSTPSGSNENLLKKKPPGVILEEDPPIHFMFDLSKRISKVSKKDTPKLALDSSESFIAIRQKEIAKMEEMQNLLVDQKTIEAMEKMQRKPDFTSIAGAPDETLRDTLKGSLFFKKPLAKTDEKYSTLERVDHKVNTALMYKDLTCVIVGENTLIVQRKLQGDAKKDIIEISRNESTHKTHITAKDFEAEDQDLWLMVEYARDHSSSGKFTITDCEHNAEAAIQLFVFGKLAKLDPQLPEPAKKAIDEYLKNPEANAQLQTMYTTAIRTPLDQDTLMETLRTWQMAKAANKTRPTPTSLF
ncbi:MAG: hypothetical protein KBD23_00720, partial [Gammaproteobacteria bacterium]|nr:hypothetical protein [Gammaproteobacteria bacterium]